MFWSIPAENTFIRPHSHPILEHINIAVSQFVVNHSSQYANEIISVVHVSGYVILLIVIIEPHERSHGAGMEMEC